MEAAPVTQAAQFVQRWSTSGGSERANYALFLTELCDLLGVPHPEPSLPENARNAYVFDRDVTFTNGDGTTSTGFADMCKAQHHAVTHTVESGTLSPPRATCCVPGLLSSINGSRPTTTSPLVS
jgi:hypothetical protein